MRHEPSAEVTCWFDLINAAELCLSLDSSLHLPTLRTSQTHLLFLFVPIGCSSVLHEARAVYGSTVEVLFVRLWSHLFVS